MLLEIYQISCICFLFMLFFSEKQIQMICFWICYVVVLYAVTASYFAGVMVRLMLTLTPVVCVLASIAFSVTLDNYIHTDAVPIDDGDEQEEEEQEQKEINNDKKKVW